MVWMPQKKQNDVRNCGPRHCLTFCHNCYTERPIRRPLLRHYLPARGLSRSIRHRQGRMWDTTFLFGVLRGLDWIWCKLISVVVPEQVICWHMHSAPKHLCKFDRRRILQTNEIIMILGYPIMVCILTEKYCFLPWKKPGICPNQAPSLSQNIGNHRPKVGYFEYLWINNQQVWKILGWHLAFGHSF